MNRNKHNPVIDTANQPSYRFLHFHHWIAHPQMHTFCKLPYRTLCSANRTHSSSLPYTVPHLQRFCTISQHPFCGNQIPFAPILVTYYILSAQSSPACIQQPLIHNFFITSLPRNYITKQQNFSIKIAYNMYFCEI